MATVRRVRTRPRTQVACLACKTRKQKCDPIGSACRNCIKAGRDCIVEDPTTKRYQPRGYLQSLEERVAMLEGLLNEPSMSSDHLYPAIQGGKSAATGDIIMEGGAFGGTIQPVIDGTSTALPVGNSMPPDHLLDVASTSGTSSNRGGAHGRNPSAGSRAMSEPADDLSPEIGLLCLKAAGQGPYHYVGSSSSFSFARIVLASLKKVKSQGPGMTLTGVRDRSLEDMPSAVAASLPPRNIGRILADAYFDNIHPQYPILHRPTYDLWESHVMDARDNGLVADPVPSFFVNMVFAVGTLIMPRALDCPAECYYAAAQDHLSEVIQLDGLESVQAILSCAMYTLRSHVGVSVWSLSGLALRQCIELGYHRNPRRLRANRDYLQLEMQRRVFWISYNLDRCAAVTLGRPFGISDNDIDVELPLDISDDMVTPGGISGIPRSLPTEPSTTMSACIHMIKLRCVWSRIKEQLYPIDPPASFQPSDEALVNSFTAELKQWLADVPARQPVALALSTFSTIEWFKLAYNHSILLLYRRLITNDGQGSTNSFLECCTAARDICVLYRKLFLTNPVSYTWGALHILFLAGLTYLHCLITCPSVRSSIGQDEISHTCSSCTIVLVIMAERWKAAAVYRDTFDMLSNATISLLVKNRPPPTVEPGQVMAGENSWDQALPTNVLEGANLEQCQEASWYFDGIAEIGMCDSTEQLLTAFLGDLTWDASSQL